MEPYKYVCKYLDALHSGNWEKAEEYLACARKGIVVVIPVKGVVDENVNLYMNTCSYLDALHSGKWELSEKYLDCARRAYDILFGGIVMPGVAQNPVNMLLTNLNQPLLTNLNQEILV